MAAQAQQQVPKNEVDRILAVPPNDVQQPLPIAQAARIPQQQAEPAGNAASLPYSSPFYHLGPFLILLSFVSQFLKKSLSPRSY